MRSVRECQKLALSPFELRAARPRIGARRFGDAVLKMPSRATRLAQSLDSLLVCAVSYCEVSARAGKLWAELDNKRPEGHISTREISLVVSVTDAGFGDDGLGAPQSALANV